MTNRKTELDRATEDLKFLDDLLTTTVIQGTQKIFAWLVIGNGTALALLYNATLQRPELLNRGAKSVAVVFVIGLVCAFAANFYWLATNGLIVLNEAKGRGHKTGEIAAIIAMFASMICFVAGVLAPITGLLWL